jgi:hypothetical protein
VVLPRDHYAFLERDLDKGSDPLYAYFGWEGGEGLFFAGSRRALLFVSGLESESCWEFKAPWRRWFLFNS